VTRKVLFLAVFVTPLLIGASVRADNLCGAEDPVCCDCPTSNWYVGLDVPVLKPHLGALGVDVFGTEIGITPKHDFEVSPRFFLGWENAEGLGVRARYWTFDSDASQTFPAPLPIFGAVIEGTETSLAAQTLDLEATQRACLGNLQFQLAGGFRYAKMETGLSVFGTTGVGAPVPFNAGIGMDFEGGGPTIALDVRRPFGCRGLALVGGARSSWLYGQTDVHLIGDLGGIPVSVTADDHMMQINEMNLGIEWSRCLARGGKITAAALWEAQAWEWAPIAGLVHQDIGLTGPTFSFSYMR
jgi:hypothetical protein